MTDRTDPDSAEADAPQDRATAVSALTVDAAWSARVRRQPDAPALTYFNQTMTAGEADNDAGALAAGLLDLGVKAGDRVAIQLQNIPQYVLALLASWKIGAVPVLINPMYKDRELLHIVNDAEPSILICADEVAKECRRLVTGTTRVLGTSTSHPQPHSSTHTALPDQPATTSPCGDGLLDLMRTHAGGVTPEAHSSPEDVALLAYTSGTTGPAKGAIITHANILAVVRGYAASIGLSESDVTFAMAPLFHITGLVVNAAISLLTGGRLVLAGRFDPHVALDAFLEQRVTYTIGSITAYHALRAAGATREHFASARFLASGGAPIPAATVDAFVAEYGVYIHNGYGMTETASAVVAVPSGLIAPTAGSSRALSIGRPLPGVRARVTQPDGTEAPTGLEGELEIQGPQVSPGYWRNPEATAASRRDGWLRTGDGAMIDADGWVFLADRLKDQINVSGYKVWPREVEDVIHELHEVHEAAVVGLPDDYTGERVVAFVALKAGTDLTADEVTQHVGRALAAYKRPKEVHFVVELPKTQTGKVTRAELRRPGAPSPQRAVRQ